MATLGTMSVIFQIVDQGRTVLQNINSQLTTTAATATRATAVVGGLFAGLAAEQVVRTLVQVGTAMGDIAREGAMFERVWTAFEVQLGRVGERGVDALSALRVAARGTVSDYQLMISANKGLALGVADSSAELAKLIEISTALGRRTGLSQEQSLERLMVGIGRLSPRILDDLGIAVNLTQVYRDQTGKAASELTQEQKIRALLNDTLAKGNEILKEYTGGLDDSASAFERAGAAWANFKAELGQTAPMQAAVDGLDYVTQALAAMNRQSEISGGNAGLETIVTEMEQVQKAIDAINRGDLQSVPDFRRAFADRGATGNWGITSGRATRTLLEEQLKDLDFAYREALAQKRDFENAWILSQPSAAGGQGAAFDPLKQMREMGDAVLRFLPRMEQAQAQLRDATLAGDPAAIAQAEARISSLSTLLTDYATKYNIAAEVAGKPLIDEPSLAKAQLLTQEAANSYDVFAERQRKLKDEAKQLTQAFERQNAVLDQLTTSASSARSGLLGTLTSAFAGQNQGAALDAYSRASAQLEGQIYYIENIASKWMTTEQVALEIANAYQRANQFLEQQAGLAERIQQLSARREMPGLGDDINRALGDLRSAQARLQAAERIGSGTDVAWYTAKVQVLSDELLTLAGRYNVLAALSGVELIDVEQLLRGKLAAEGAADAIDIFNAAQQGIPPEAARAAAAVRREAAEIQAFRSQLLGFRQGLLGDLLGNVDVFGAAGVEGQYRDINAQLWATEKTLGSVANTEDGRVSAIIRMSEAYQNAVGPINDQAAALRSAGDSASDYADTVQGKLKSAYESLRGVVEDALNDQINILDTINVDPAEHGGYQDVPAENAKRLADIMVNGLKGQDWLEEFKAEVPQVWDELIAAGDMKAKAAEMLTQFQQGLRPELIDFTALKDQIKQKIRTQMTLKDEAVQITNELIAELGQGRSADIKRYMADILGEGVGENVDLASGILSQMEAQDFLASVESAGATAGEHWGALFMATVGDNLPGPLLSMLVTLVTPGVLAEINKNKGKEGSK